MIQDKYSDLPVSRQRKHQLRHPGKAKALKKRWLSKPENKQKVAEYQKAWREANPDYHKNYRKNKNARTEV
jgi:hypothetical protein